LKYNIRKVRHSVHKLVLMHAFYLQFFLKFFVVHHGKYTTATAKKSTFFSFLRFRVKYERIRIAPLFLNLHLLLARNINSTVAILSSFISLLMTFKFGKDRAYKLGLLLRNKYNSFLGDVYYPSNVYARSTWISRTKMTLQLVLAALYSPVNIQQWNSNISWPIDMIHSSQQEEDTLLLPFACYT